jgi:hypothetical protein
MDLGEDVRLAGQMQAVKQGLRIPYCVQRGLRLPGNDSSHAPSTFQIDFYRQLLRVCGHLSRSTVISSAVSLPGINVDGIPGAFAMPNQAKGTHYRKSATVGWRGASVC